MRFEELASKAGKAALDAGRHSRRPPFPHLLAKHHRRNVIAGWATSLAAFTVVVVGLALLWPQSPTELTSPASSQTTTTIAAQEEPGLVGVGRDACPVTVPGDSSFSPPSSAPEEPAATYDSVWYGTPELWTMIRRGGESWSGLPMAADGSLTQKTFWWSEDLVSIAAPALAIEVTASQFAGSAPVVTSERITTGGNPELGVFAIAELRIPQEGCWEITARHGGSTLVYVVWVGDES